MLTVAAGAAATARAADLFLSDEPEIYVAIDKLNAAGHLPGFLANTRPYSMQAVRAAADAASLTSHPEGLDGELLRWLASYSAPKTMGRVTAAAAYSDARLEPSNNEGIPRPGGWSAQGSIAARGEKTPYLSAQLRAASFRGEGDDDGNRLLDASIEAGYRYASVQAGRISTWYGPGRNGALILTNNAAPYPGVRVHNPEPIPMTGWFSFLGNAQYDLFLARLDKDRPIPHSLLFGMRLASRPGRCLELGVSRVLHYGGEGEGNGLADWWNAFKGTSDNDPGSKGNQIAGFDVELTVPLSVQPFQFYLDAAGEDEAGSIPAPSKWAFLWGVYLPSLLGSSNWDLRVEYADTYGGKAKEASWYDHPYNPHRYRGQVLGHPMGGGSRDWFVGSRYYILPSTFAEISYENILHDRGVQSSIGSPGERRTRYSAGLTGWLTPSWRAEARAATDSVTGQGGIPGSEGTDFSAWLALSYQATSLSDQAE